MTTYDCWTPPHKLQLPYMKLLLKVHKLDKPASYDNLTKHLPETLSQQCLQPHCRFVINNKKLFLALQTRIFTKFQAELVFLMRVAISHCL